MKVFLKELEKESKKYFDINEAESVVSYYEEIINDRLDSGEDLETVLKDYEIKKIVKEMIPEIVINRDLKNPKNIGKSSWQLLVILLSAPMLIPIAIIYLALMIVLISLGLSGLALIVAPVVSIIPYIIEVVNYTTNLGVILGFLGLGLIGLALMIVIGVYVIKAALFLIKKMIKGVSRIVLRKKGKHA